MRHPVRTETTPMPAWARTRSLSPERQEARPAGPAAGLGRREFLTMAAAGTAAAAIGVTIAALDPATALGATAMTGNASPEPPSALNQKRELRGMWIASVANIDWPSASGLDAEAQKAEFVRHLEVARENRLNAVFVQVRPTADAMWDSPYEPWSQYLTGTQGVDPGYDPLAFMVEEAHRRNIELHAWFNPYRVSMQPDPAQLVADHPARQHPDWVWAYGGRLYFDPGIPEAQEHIQRAILHAVETYDIDGVHFDDYFYPYPVAGETLPDAATFERYGAGFDSIEDWRRANVDRFVETMSSRVKAAKPWAKFGISPFGIWRNSSTDPLGSDTGGSQSYDDQFADTRKWVLEGWLDYINPQIYWQIGLAVADYAALVPWWAELAAQSGTQLYVGEALYKMSSGVFTDPDELTNHLDLCREVSRDVGPVHGNVYYSAVHVPADPQGGMSRVVADHYQQPALVPPMPHLPADPVVSPVLANARRVDGGVRLHVADIGVRIARATSFAVYRVRGVADSVDTDVPTNLVGTFRATGGRIQTWLDTTAEPGTPYTYAVTALDRVWNESGPSRPSTVR
ncbi:family 10 glycosylhydrolase [Promicromonospora citrea]|uniref:Glycosyl hydrolase n=1 Tax=Promicromonospora citrea TaxID=43677 RepID=A0A8H9L695_9MICO|nr:family 10 glycosylhydrolase [Promicromonospora citrea]GGM35751.1 glycosyl hydrolase [Promicromonospora citrea]